MKPTNCPAKGKKWGKKSKKEGRGESKLQKSRLKILLSAHAWTSQANILHLDQKAAKYIWPVNGFVVSFSSK